jgi:NTP pyrophosphatase (non-canonical NTP hydrolase)
LSDEAITLLELRKSVSDFIAERQWQQFHNPKDLVAAIAVEAGELQELFLWKTVAESASSLSEGALRERVEEELADVMILCLSLANAVGLDVSKVVMRKLAANNSKYPLSLSRGRADKYTAYLPAREESK